jgi:glycosyltransferase involved in cell wall biosynthesis
MIREAPYEVKTFYPESFSRREVDGTLIILNNTGLFKRSDLEWIVGTQTYIKYEHDYSFCKHRHATEHDCNVECAQTLNFYTKVFNNSILNIFLSPLHRDVYLKYMDLDLSKIHLQPSPIDVSRFEYAGPKEDIYLAVGEDGWHKGTDLIRKEFPGIKFIGGNNKIPYEQVPGHYKLAKYFVHKPRWIEPFGRAVAEAYCAHCELIVNRNIGFLSYDWDYEDRSFVKTRLKRAPKVFWKAVCS